MPAKSKAQQKAAGAALSAKRGKAKPSELIGASRQMYESMSEEQLDDMASTPRKNKPEYSPRSPAKKRPAKKQASKAATKARKRPSTTKGKTANAQRKVKRATRPKRAPKKAARRRA